MQRTAHFKLDEYLAFKFTDEGEKYIETLIEKYPDIQLKKNDIGYYYFTFREFSKYFKDVIDRDDIVLEIIGILN